MITKYTNNFYSKVLQNIPKYQMNVALWQSGHRIRLRNIRPGLESRQGMRYLGNLSNAVVYL
jgi:hypothetical protein